MNDPATAADDVLPPGTHAGEYVIEALIGRGMFGTVYRAKHPVIGATAAVKVLDTRLSNDKTMIARFIDEARAASRARHPSIVEVFNFGRMPDGRRYFVMELLEGEPLDELLERRGALPLSECVAILRPVAAALASAHAAGVTHRDIKPANLYICADGPPKIVDFGVAKLLDGRATRERTAQGMVIGTPSYMSPEQCLGEAVTPAADVYALGIVAWRMLAGRVPFESDSGIAVLNAHISDEPPPLHREQPDLKPATTLAVQAMLAKSPSERPDPVAAIEALAVSAGMPGSTKGALIAGGAVALAAIGWLVLASADTDDVQPTAPVSAAPATVSVAPPTEAAPVTQAAPVTAAPQPVRFTVIGAPSDGRLTIDGLPVVLDAKGRFSLMPDALPVELLVEAPRHRARTLTLTAETTGVDARLERIPKTVKPVVKPKPQAGKRVDPHGIDPW